MTNDDREAVLNQILNTQRVAEIVVNAIREDYTRSIEPKDLIYQFHKDDETPYLGARFPEELIDTTFLMGFLARLICPPVCVGSVNSTGWHQVCEGKAQVAIRALGLVPPELTPIPKVDGL